LTVYGNYNDAIASKDELTIQGGTINVIAVDDGIRGKDYLLIEDGHITVTAAGDGLKSDNEENPELGYITIENGLIRRHVRRRRHRGRDRRLHHGRRVHARLRRRPHGLDPGGPVSQGHQGTRQRTDRSRHVRHRFRR
jgi:hypothetical protein